jgi:hypothetical protein
VCAYKAVGLKTLIKTASYTCRVGWVGGVLAEPDSSTSTGTQWPASRKQEREVAEREEKRESRGYGIWESSGLRLRGFKVLGFGM